MEKPFTASLLNRRRLISSLHDIAVQRLTEKQKKLLDELSRLDKTLTATKFVEKFSRKFDCGRSTLFLALNNLEKCSLVEIDKGKSVDLTSEAEILVERGLYGSN